MTTATEEDATCIRTWYSTWTSCKCPPCRASRYRRRKLVEAGLITRTPSSDAWAALDKMLAAEWTPAAIASASGLTNRSVRSILNEGERRNIGPVLARMIVNHGEPTRGYVGVTGARRKTRALAVMGHTQGDIAAAAGLGENRWTTIASVQRGDTKTITPRLAAAIDEAWRTLTRKPGASEKTAARAAAERWPGVGSWDNIDDPEEIPEEMGLSIATPTQRRAAMRALARDGVDRRDIAVEFGCHIKTVGRALAGDAA